MIKIPVAVEKRLKDEVPRFQKVLEDARRRDINEADTVVIVTDMLERVFGMDKYMDVTREYAIKGTFVDLAVQINGRLEYFIEVKAIGLGLKQNHLRQAVDYAAKEGVRWAVLTNGIDWQIHRVTVDGQVTSDEMISFNFLEISTRKPADLEALFLLCKRGVGQDLMQDFFDKKQACNRFVIGATLCTEEVSNTVRRILKRMSPDLKISVEEIADVISSEVIKREVLESEAGLQAKKSFEKFVAKEKRAKKQIAPAAMSSVKPLETDSSPEEVGTN